MIPNVSIFTLVARPILVVLLFGASGCDPTAVALRHPGVEAGMSPTGGGEFDTRLAGCVVEWRLVAADWVGSVTLEYDSLGRRTRYAATEGPYTLYDVNVSWDEDSCPTTVSGGFPNGVGTTPREWEYTQACDTMGNVIESPSSGWTVHHYSHTYDGSGAILATVVTSPARPGWAYEYEYEWAAGRVVAMTSGVAGEEPEYAEDRAYTDGGWVSSHEETPGEEATWTYDEWGRAITGWGDRYTYEYEGLGVFPIRGTNSDATAEYTVVCE